MHTVANSNAGQPKTRSPPTRSNVHQVGFADSVNMLARQRRALPQTVTDMPSPRYVIKRCARHVPTRSAKLCWICRRKKAVASGRLSRGDRNATTTIGNKGNWNAKGVVGNKGNRNAKGAIGNEGHRNAKGTIGNTGNRNAKGTIANKGNRNAKGTIGHKGNGSHGPSKISAGRRSGVRRSATICLVVEKQSLGLILKSSTNIGNPHYFDDKKKVDPFRREQMRWQDNRPRAWLVAILYQEIVPYATSSSTAL